MIEVDALVEAYDILKAYIPSKDRQEASDSLMGTLVDLLNDEDLKDFAKTDKYTQQSYKECIGEDDLDEDDDSIDDDSQW